ncbi:hypothetical protein C7H84_30315 [Burkholderia sp. Nafp2/4-1b]|uniref:hypothetical protein n=1 Tax=Burkholderia sp. Nafp2/4-1b TaxID=2116686 RepID=UPI000EF86CE9|nr:hypothetical protein [Burkholderia sp. Nafp2/4-1b]RKT99570.1 hypothetical protein C7H84_30315 [Burkholderia sp. Nafp2/4-1b]
MLAPATARASTQRFLGRKLGRTGHARQTVAYRIRRHFNYQLLKPLADDRCEMTVQIPVMPGRDLFEISMSNVNGVDTMAASGWRCQRA